MSLRERLRQAASPDELRTIMRELVVSGDRNWTYLTITRFIPATLVGELNTYFDEHGRLRNPAELGFQPPQDSPDEGSDAARHWRVDLSLSELMATFHEQLRGARAVALARSDPVDSYEPADEMPDVTPDVDPANAVEAVPEDDPFVCPICQTRTDANTAVFRGTEMCEACADLLRYGPR